MAFKDIVGQERAVEFFLNSVNRDKIAHAYLFLGAQGLGKTLLARNLAKFLNCEDPVKKGDLRLDCCDKCASCRKIDEFNHPDVLWIEAGSSKRISIDEIRLLRREASLKAYEGKFKVFVILEVSNLTEEAANSLLKTLEEPPDHCLIILTSTNKSDLLPTIVSRCQIVKFYPLDRERLKEILTNQYSLKGDDVHFLAHQAEGRIGIALGAHADERLSRKNRLIEQVLQGKRRYPVTNIFNIKDKKELANQIRYLLNWFRDILVFKAGLPASGIINVDRIETIKSGTAKFDFQELEEIITKIDQAHRLIEQNVNPKIALEVMLRSLGRC